MSEEQEGAQNSQKDLQRKKHRLESNNFEAYFDSDSNYSSEKRDI